jgi:hypothetical protein
MSSSLRPTTLASWLFITFLVMPGGFAAYAFSVGAGEALANGVIDATNREDAKSWYFDHQAQIKSFEYECSPYDDVISRHALCPIAVIGSRVAVSFWNDKMQYQWVRILVAFFVPVIATAAVGILVGKALRS